MHATVEMFVTCTEPMGWRIINKFLTKLYKAIFIDNMLRLKSLQRSSSSAVNRKLTERQSHNQRNKLGASFYNPKAGCDPESITQANLSSLKQANI